MRVKDELDSARLQVKDHVDSVKAHVERARRGWVRRKFCLFSVAGILIVVILFIVIGLCGYLWEMML